MSEDASGHRERLRARLLSGGGDAFHDYELLEYILGLAIPRRDTKPLAKRLLAEFGTFAALLAASPAELSRVDGLTEGAAPAYWGRLLRDRERYSTRILTPAQRCSQRLGSARDGQLDRWRDS